MTDGNTWDGIESLESKPNTEAGTMWFASPGREIDRCSSQADKVALVLDPGQMTCKFGFLDGDIFFDDIEVPGPSWLGHRVLERLCREAWPGAAIWFVKTCHNPVRCDDVTGLESVEITMGQLIEAIDRATEFGDNNRSMK